MQYILTESEYQDFLASKNKVQVLEHRLAVANEVREANRVQIKKLDGLVYQGKQSIKERDQRITDLIAEVRRLRDEKVCFATNVQTNVVKIVPAIKADTYRKLGWIVSDEEFIIDRSPACEPFDWSGTPGV